MRACWIILVLLAVVPAGAFHVLEWTGGTAALRYISTTVWESGRPTNGEVALMFLSVITWAWVKVIMNVFLLAAAPFLVADLRRARRGQGPAGTAPAP